MAASENRLQGGEKSIVQKRAGSRKFVQTETMLTGQRKQYLLDLLHKTGQIVAKTVSQELGLSEDTIRRDLRELASEGRLQRVHGGALPASPAVGDFAARQQLAPDGKVAMGRAAAGLVRAGQVVILDGGTSTLQLARHLPLDLQATVVTHSPTIAVALVEHPSIEVVLIGGKLFKHSVVAVGAAAIEAIARIRADICFIGVTGIHPKAGLSTGDLEESHVKRALIASAAETYVLVSAEKLNAASPYVIVPTAQVSGIIVEPGIAEEALKPYERAGLTVIRA
jgi:DeoR/GlpR family transcriptional regulator of sugar metabolism